MTERTELSDFVILPAEDKIIQPPLIPSGDFGRTLFKKYEEAKRTQYDSNQYLQLQLRENGEIVQSTIFDATIIDDIINEEYKGALRTASLANSGDENILQMIEDKHYVDLRALVLRTEKDSLNKRNNSLIKYLMENHVDFAEIEKKGPALIQGFTLAHWQEDETGYKLKFVPKNGDKFQIRYDDRLLEKYDQWKFDKVDKIGMPEALDKTKGSRTWYTREDGLSGMCLNWNLDLGLDDGSLAYSSGSGRVVLVRGSAAR